MLYHTNFIPRPRNLTELLFVIKLVFTVGHRRTTDWVRRYWVAMGCKKARNRSEINKMYIDVAGDDRSEYRRKYHIRWLISKWRSRHPEEADAVNRRSNELDCPLGWTAKHFFWKLQGATLSKVVLWYQNTVYKFQLDLWVVRMGAKLLTFWK